MVGFARRQLLHLAAGTAALPVVSRIARAQTYPTHPVRLIVGFAAGGQTDIIARPQRAKGGGRTAPRSSLRSNHVSWIARFHFLKVAPVSCAIAPSVVCAALRPSRKSLSE